MKAGGAEALATMEYLSLSLFLVFYIQLFAKRTVKLFLPLIPNYTLIRTKLPSTANVTVSSALGTLDLLISRFHAGHWPANMDHASQRRGHGVTVLWGHFRSHYISDNY